MALGNTNLGFSGSGGGGGSSPSSIKVCSIVSGQTVDTTPRFGNNSVFYNFSISDCTNSYAGTLIANWQAASGLIQFNEINTNSIGDTTGVSFDFTVVGSVVNLIVNTPTSGWKMSYVKNVLQDCCSVPYTSGAMLITNSGNLITTESGEILITN